MVELLVPYGLLGIMLLFAEMSYLRIARSRQIIDNPNERSSHSRPVIRGGGIIFLLAIIPWFAMTGNWPFFFAGAVLVGIGSFIDDMTELPAGVRFAVHLLAVCLLFYDASIFNWPLWLAIVTLIVSIGTINAFNFMDGINGITGIYGIVTLGSFIYIDTALLDFTDASLAGSLVVGLIVFLFFNFRKRALVFAGDVGSVTMAFVIIFLLLQLIVASGNYLWPLLFLLYGTDSIVTIIARLRKRENIFKAHRQHLYQYLSNELKFSHRFVATGYGVVQLVINIIAIYAIHQQMYALALGVAVVFVVVFVIARQRVLAKVRRSVVAG